MYGITVVGFALWFVYGLMLGKWPLIFTNSVCLGLSAFIFAMKVLSPRTGPLSPTPWIQRWGSPDLKAGRGWRTEVRGRHVQGRMTDRGRCLL